MLHMCPPLLFLMYCLMQYIFCVLCCYIFQYTDKYCNNTCIYMHIHAYTCIRIICMYHVGIACICMYCMYRIISNRSDFNTDSDTCKYWHICAYTCKYMQIGSDLFACIMYIFCVRICTYCCQYLHVLHVSACIKGTQTTKNVKHNFYFFHDKSS